jgi:hypothetical protein
MMNLIENVVIYPGFLFWLNVNNMELGLYDFPTLSEEDMKLMQLAMEREISLSKERSSSKKPIPPATFEILDAVNLKSIIIPNPGDFSLDAGKVDKYLSLIDHDILQTTKVLIDKTKHVTFTDLLTIMSNLLTDFISAHTDTPFYLYFPTDFSSENIFAMFLWEKLSSLNIKGFVTADHKFPPNENVNVLVFDDCMFTGQNMDLMLYDFKTNNPAILITFHLFVAYSSDVAFKFINDSVNNPFFASSHVNKLIWHIHEKLDDVHFDDTFIEECFEHYGSRLPLYFDYKIPMTTCDYIYKGINPKTRQEIGHTTKHPVTSEFKTSAYKAYINAAN